MTRPSLRKRKQPEPLPLPDWLAWPVRVVAVAVVLPFKLLWELFAAIHRYVVAPVSRLIHRYILRPLGIAFDFVVVRPMRWLLRHLVVVPLAWLIEHVIAPALQALWDGTVWLAKRTRLFWVYLGKAIWWTAVLLYRYLLRPIGIAVGFVIGILVDYGLRPAGQLLAWFWRWVIVPVGRAVAWSVAWSWNHSVVLLWRYLVAPTGRWIRDAVLRPVGRTVGRVLATIGLR